MVAVIAGDGSNRPVRGQSYTGAESYRWKKELTG